MTSMHSRPGRTGNEWKSLVSDVVAGFSKRSDNSASQPSKSIDNSPSSLVDTSPSIRQPHNPNRQFPAYRGFQVISQDIRVGHVSDLVEGFFLPAHLESKLAVNFEVSHGLTVFHDVPHAQLVHDKTFPDRPDVARLA